MANLKSGSPQELIDSRIPRSFRLESPQVETFAEKLVKPSKFYQLFHTPFRVFHYVLDKVDDGMC